MECHSLESTDAESPVTDTLVTHALIDGAFINSDLCIAPRTRRSYVAKGILPPPDTNIQGRDMWLVSTYQEFKRRLLAGHFAMNRTSNFRQET